MASTNRSAQRELVRWTDDLDKSLLLFIVHACTEAGVKLPWKRCSELMSVQYFKTISEGALVQHVAKNRAQMVKEKEKQPDNVDLLVPPPYTRGLVIKTPLGISKPGSRKRKANDITETLQAIKNKSKGRKIKRDPEEDEDADGEYGSKPKKAKKPKKTTVKKESEAVAPMPTSVKEETEEDDDLAASAAASPRTHTRSAKVDYAEIAAGTSDYEDSGPDEDAYSDTKTDIPAPLSTFQKSPGSSNATSPKAEADEEVPATPVKTPYVATTQHNSNAAMMPPISSNTFARFGNLNNCTSMLQSPFDPFNFGGMALPSIGPSYGFEVPFDPFTAMSSSKHQDAARADAGLWTPPTTIAPASTRNNSTASSITSLNPTQTPGTDITSSFGSSSAPAADEFQWDDSLMHDQGYLDSFNDWMKIDGNDMA